MQQNYTVSELIEPYRMALDSIESDQILF